MQGLKPLSESQKQHITIAIKNRQDISNLLVGYSIQGLNLSWAIIKTFNRIEDDLSNCNFSHAIIGQEKTITNLTSSILFHANFTKATFLGSTWLKNVNARFANFTACSFNDLHYQYGDFRHTKWCGATFRLSTNHCKGAKFSGEFLVELGKIMNLDVSVKPIEE